MGKIKLKDVSRIAGSFTRSAFVGGLFGVMSGTLISLMAVAIPTWGLALGGIVAVGAAMYAKWANIQQYAQYFKVHPDWHRATSLMASGVGVMVGYKLSNAHILPFTFS